MSRLSFKEKRSKPNGARFTVDCYFDRAMQWRPEDASVRLVWGIHLLKTGNQKGGIEQLEKALSLGLDSGNAHYNLGLAFFEVGEYSRSASHAIRAYQLNFALPGLKEKLRKIGKWPSPEEERRISESFSAGEVDITENNPSGTKPSVANDAVPVSAPSQE
jgi:tetratricopeptide (TPR) repeat protein